MSGTTSPAEVETGACHVYGIVRSGVDVPADESLVPDDTQVRVISDGEVAAIVAMIDPGRTLGHRADLMSHSGVLNAVAATGAPVIPVRFGSVLTTPDAVADELLRPNQERWTQLLDELDGLAQFTLRGTYVQGRVLSEVVDERADVAELRERTVGRDEQESYAERVRLGELVAHAVEDKRIVDIERVRAALEPHCTAIRTTPGTGVDGLVDVAALVSDEGRSAFEAAAERLAEAMHERASFKLLGPLAPFDFVDEG